MLFVYPFLRYECNSFNVMVVISSRIHYGFYNVVAKYKVINSYETEEHKLFNAVRLHEFTELNSGDIRDLSTTYVRPWGPGTSYIVTVSPVVVVYCPKSVHLHSLTPRIWSLYRHFSSRSCFVPWCVKHPVETCFGIPKTCSLTVDSRSAFTHSDHLFIYLFITIYG